jgi:iron(III) transport system permease protein
MKRLTLLGLWLFLGLFLLYPLSRVALDALGMQAFQAGQGGPSFRYFQVLFENPFYLGCFANSLGIASVVTILALGVTLPLAYLCLRYDFPAKALCQGAILLPLVLPPFVGAIGLRQILARFGSLNLLLAHWGWVDLTNPPGWLGGAGWWGVVAMEGLHLYPILFLSCQAAMANVDPSLRDAALNMGASGWRVFRTVTVPLAGPGIFAGSALVWVSAFTDLGVPLMFDYAAVVPVQIFNLVTQVDNPLGSALVMVTLGVVAVLFLLARWWGGAGYAMMGRSAANETVIRLNGIRGVAVVTVVGGFIAVSLFPHVGVVVQALSLRWFMTVLPSEWSGAFFAEVLSLPQTLTGLGNSLGYAGAAVGVDVVLGAACAYLLAREQFFGKRLFELLVMLPLALPGLVMAFACYAAFTRAPFAGWAWWDPRENPTALLVVAYAMHRLPYMVRAADAGLRQTSVTLEEASANLGASVGRTLWKITLPLIGANLIAGTIMTFSFGMLDVSAGMVLAQESAFYPLTKAIYVLMGRITPTAPSLACAMGVLAMGFLAVSLFLASRLMGQKMGQLFKA